MMYVKEEAADTAIDSPEFQRVLRLVLKQQILSLVKQLEESGEECAVLTANITNGTVGFLGSFKGEGFLHRQENIQSQFLSYCQGQRNHSEGTPLFLGQEYQVSPSVLSIATSSASTCLNSPTQHHEPSHVNDSDMQGTAASIQSQPLGQRRGAKFGIADKLLIKASEGGYSSNIDKLMTSPNPAITSPSLSDASHSVIYTSPGNFTKVYTSHRSESNSSDGSTSPTSAGVMMIPHAHGNRTSQGGIAEYKIRTRNHPTSTNSVLYQAQAKPRDRNRNPSDSGNFSVPVALFKNTVGDVKHGHKSLSHGIGKSSSGFYSEEFAATNVDDIHERQDNNLAGSSGARSLSADQQSSHYNSEVMSPNFALNRRVTSPEHPQGDVSTIDFSNIASIDLSTQSATVHGKSTKTSQLRKAPHDSANVGCDSMRRRKPVNVVRRFSDSGIYGSHFGHSSQLHDYSHSDRQDSSDSDFNSLVIDLDETSDVLATHSEGLDLSHKRPRIESRKRPRIESTHIKQPESTTSGYEDASLEHINYQMGPTQLKNRMLHVSKAVTEHTAQSGSSQGQSVKKYGKGNFIKVSTGYQCRICSRIIRHMNNTTAHMRIHVTVKPYKCQVCNQQFKYEVDRRYHFSKQHADLFAKMYMPHAQT
ncbi:hypothetical protein CHS0354_003449 [Potamilus streckersoni]|uniref:C2H2-type domain-containing protein n=1 Tax=Potamilus streckersoni TaxID=2493646 RepID=A0AAE0VZZ8_9BIVA|nr:hypothetical protein CHS0354_003449 [Potamilus streckersoni]